MSDLSSLSGYSSSDNDSDVDAAFSLHQQSTFPASTNSTSGLAVTPTVTQSTTAVPGPEMREPDKDDSEQNEPRAGMTLDQNKSRDRMDYEWANKPEMCLDSVDDIWMRNLELVLSEGDTLVFIDYENSFVSGKPQKTWSCHGVQWKSQMFRMDSKKLLATGSSEFAKMLGPTYQFRILRRRNLVNRLPKGVRFAIDLTPPLLEETSAMHVAECSLTRNMINWWQSEVQYGNSRDVVGGHDDICDCRDYRDWRKHSHLKRPDDVTYDSSLYADYRLLRFPDDYEVPTWSSFRPQEIKVYGEEKKAWLTISKPPYRDIPSYCRVRHEKCIARLMLLISGREIAVDSGPRLWTLVGVAKLLDCTRMPELQTLAMTWILNHVNAIFMERLPEEAIRIAFALKLGEVAETAFSVLVHERALYKAGFVPSRGRDRGRDVTMPPYRLLKETVFQRRKEDPGEDIDGLVQYAADQLLKRVRDTIAKLMSPCLWADIGVADAVRINELEDYISEVLLHSDWDPNASADGDSGPTDDAYMVAMECAQTYVVELNALLRRTHRKVVCESPGRGTEALTRGRAWDIGNDMFRTIRTCVTGPLPEEDIDSFRERYSQLNPVQAALLPYFLNNITMAFRKHMEEIDKKEDIGLQIMSQTARLVQVLDELCQMNPNVKANLVRRGFHQDPDTGLYMVCGWVDFKAQVWDSLTNCKDAMWKTNRMIWGASHQILNLGPNERQYLPLWAGGNDDGTGGVFQELVPPADVGPVGPGPAFHTGLTIPSSPSSSNAPALTAPTVSSGFLDGMEDLGVNSVSTAVDADSLDAQDSRTTTEYEDKSQASESTTNYNDARMAVPAPRQHHGQSLADHMGSMASSDDGSASSEFEMVDGGMDDGDGDVVDTDGSDGDPADEFYFLDDDLRSAVLVDFGA
jgi:hypothetical protein